MLPLILEEVHLLLPLLVVDRAPLALPLLDHLHLDDHTRASAQNETSLGGSSTLLLFWGHGKRSVLTRVACSSFER